MLEIFKEERQKDFFHSLSAFTDHATLRNRGVDHSEIRRCGLNSSDYFRTSDVPLLGEEWIESILNRKAAAEPKETSVFYVRERTSFYKEFADLLQQEQTSAILAAVTEMVKMEHEEESSDAICPTSFALQKVLSLLVPIYKSCSNQAALPAIFPTTSKGIRVQWVDSHRQVHMVVAASDADLSYIYHLDSADDLGQVEKLVSLESLQKLIRHFISNEKSSQE